MDDLDRLLTDKNGRVIIYDGPACRVLGAVRASGKCPAVDKLKKWQKRDMPVYLRLFDYFIRMAKTGQCRAGVKQEPHGLWAFWHEQYRLPFYKEQDDCILVFGFKKTEKKWQSKEFRKAVRIIKEDRKRIRARTS